MVLTSGGQSTLINLVFSQWWYWYAECGTRTQHELLSGPAVERRNSLKCKKRIQPESLRRDSIKALLTGMLSSICHSGPSGSSVRLPE